jgi:hypothetical protein
LTNSNLSVNNCYCITVAIRLCADVSRVRPVSTPLPTTSLAPVPHTSRSPASGSFRQRRGSSSGERGEPCGMPRRLSRASVVRVLRPRLSVSSTGQSSHILIRCSTRRSTTRRATDLRRSASRSPASGSYSPTRRGSKHDGGGRRARPLPKSRAATTWARARFLD